MHTYHEILLKRTFYLSMQFRLKPFMHTQKTILINKTYSLSHRHVHHKINNAKPSQANMHMS